MDEKISPLIIGDPSILRFSFSFEKTGSSQDAQAWGKGKASVGGIPVWFVENEDGSTDWVEWSWLDLLSFLADSWPWLLNEEGYQVAFEREQPLHPGMLWPKLKKRWTGLKPKPRDDEENAVKAFVSRHDLALGMKGIYLPQIFVLREGHECYVHADEAPIQVHPLRNVITILEEVGNFIANWVRPYAMQYNDANTKQVLKHWNERNQYSRDLYVTISTGLDDQEMKRILLSKTPQEYFEIPAGDTGELNNPGELAIAARMSKGYVELSVMADLLETIRGIPAQDTPELDAISAGIPADWRQETEPWDQGYCLALALRNALKSSPKETFNPLELLDKWNVQIVEKDFKASHIAAIAVWGKRHGPAIIVNKTGMRPEHIHGLRTTLAHEICHLLADREKKLPAAEVLGGATPLRLEKRANAFAAELLLPRELAARTATQSPSIDEALYELRDAYKVSRHVAAWQIKNSTLFDTLSEQEQQYLLAFTKGNWPVVYDADE